MSYNCMPCRGCGSCGYSTSSTTSSNADYSASQREYNMSIASNYNSE